MAAVVRGRRPPFDEALPQPPHMPSAVAAAASSGATMDGGASQSAALPIATAQAMPQGTPSPTTALAAATPAYAVGQALPPPPALRRLIEQMWDQSHSERGEV